MFFEVEYRQIILDERTSRQKAHVVRRGLFVLVSSMVYLAVTVLQISIERFRLFISHIRHEKNIIFNAYSFVRGNDDKL